MNPKLTKRLEDLESLQHEHFAGLAFFEHRAGTYLHTVTGINYTEAEYTALTQRYKTCAFLCVDRDDHAPPEFSLGDLKAWNRAVDLARQEGRDFDPVTDPDPVVRAFHRRQVEHETAERERRIAGHDGWIENLRRLKRDDLIQLEEARRQGDRGCPSERDPSSGAVIGEPAPGSGRS